MIKTFNCGIGFCIIAPRKNIKKIKRIFPKNLPLMKLAYITDEKVKINLSKSLKW